MFSNNLSDLIFQIKAEIAIWIHYTNIQHININIKKDTSLRMENKNFCLMYTYLNVLLNNKTTWTELDSHRLHYCL
jgi:hypothetical protein